MSVHYRWSAGQLFPGTRLKISAEAERKMPEVLKTVAREEDKVEGSQTKIKERPQRPLPRSNLWSATLLEAQDPEGKRDRCQWVGLQLVFKMGTCSFLEKSFWGSHENPFYQAHLDYLQCPGWGEMGLLLTHRGALKPLNLSFSTFSSLASSVSSACLSALPHAQIRT